MQTLIRIAQITFIAVVMAACFAGFVADADADIARSRVRGAYPTAL